MPPTLPLIPPFDAVAADAAAARQATLTKPPGSLGRLETLSVQLAGMTGAAQPAFPRKTVVVMAGDHGVVAEGVSAYPATVTPQMVMNFLRGGAAINVLARHTGAQVLVVDVGIAAELPPQTGLLIRKIGHGTRNMTREPAMSRAQAEDAVTAGMDVAAALCAHGLDLVATGDMGIGNTTAASAMTAAFTGLPARAVTGRGTGVDDAGLARKIDAIERALAVNTPDPDDPLDVLSKVGGLEIAGLTGVILGAAAQRVPVVLDGFISAAAALAAAAFAPDVTRYLIAAHRSVEIGHRILLERLGLSPLLDLELRLGEGSGAVLAFSLIDAAVNLLREMATFDEAGVDRS